MSSNIENNKRIAKNTFFLYVRMFITMLVGLYTSRIVLKTLGVDDYGIYNVVGGIVAMFTFFNSSMSAASSRFISFGLGKNNIRYSSDIYNQSVIIHFIIAIVVFVLVETIGLWFLQNKLVIPCERMDSAVWVLHASAITCVFTIISVPSLASIISHEKMSAFAYMSIIDVSLKLLIAFFLTISTFDKLKIYAILIVITQILNRMIYIIYCRKKFVETKQTLILKKSIFKEMFFFAGWNVLGNLALLSVNQGVNLMLNIFFGPIVNAAQGMAMQVVNQVNNFVNNIRMAFNPQITKSYSENNIEYMHQLIIYSSIFSYYMLLIIILPVGFITDQLLSLWLVKVPAYTSVFLKLILIYTLVNSFANPIIIAIHSTGKIKKFQIIESFFMLLTLPIAYICLVYGLLPQSVYIIQIIMAAISQMGRLYIALPILCFSFSNYTKKIILPTMRVTFFSLILPMLIYIYWHAKGLQYAIIQSIICVFVVIISIYTIGLNKDEKKSVLQFIIKNINKHK
jgi:O-antigen/teichoic acid export membrane protein